MWLSHSFTIGLGMCLIVFVPIGWLATESDPDATIVDFFAHPATWLYILGFGLWWYHNRCRSRRDVDRFDLWASSLLFLLVAIGYYLFYVWDSVFIPDAPASAYWNALALPLCYPVYLFVISSIGFGRSLVCQSARG